MTIHLDDIPIKVLMDTGADATIITKNESLRFPHWRFQSGSFITRVGGQQATKMTTWPVDWQDLDGNLGPFIPVVADVPHNL